MTPPQREVITNDSLVAKSPMAGFSTTSSSKQARSLEIAIGTIEKSHIHRHHIFKSPASPLTVKVIIIFSRSNKANIIKLPQTPSSSSSLSYKCRFRNQVCEHWCNHNLHIFIGPRYPWSDLWVRVSLTHATFCRLNWCDSGCWRYQLILPIRQSKAMQVAPPGGQTCN